jgi:hypothetical protein
MVATLNSADSLLSYLNRPGTRNKFDSILNELQQITQNINQITKEIKEAFKR